MVQNLPLVNFRFRLQEYPPTDWLMTPLQLKHHPPPLRHQEAAGTRLS